MQIYYCYIFPSFFCSIFTFEQLWIFKEKKTQLSRMYLLSSNLSSECLDLLHDGKKLSRSIKKYCSFSKEKNILQLAEKNLLLMESMSNLLELNLIEKTFRENYFSIKNIFEQAAFELELELGTSIDLNFINNNNNDSDFIFSNELFMSRIASNIISNIANHGSKKSAYIEFESCLKSWSFKIKISNYTNLNHINLNSKSRGLSIIKKLTEVQGGSSLIDIKDNIFICQIQIPFKKSVVYI
ncbi:hypothetical protein [Fluviispira multicolorata]|uniref:Uncharacterized protein n=1 Tax=Fluviispira multicolorata TaxID=2654512 RepID=A0A833JGC1_9BACT|nr:hypothetical protein [Fluviispira multicolorata]KAB8032112.1 hypothetical protein GCL57_05550 [Fluviispira multicolorata]